MIRIDISTLYPYSSLGPETEFTKKQNPEASLWIVQRFLNPSASLWNSFPKSYRFQFAIRWRWI